MVRLASAAAVALSSTVVHAMYMAITVAEDRQAARGEIALDASDGQPTPQRFSSPYTPIMRDDYIKEALKVIPDPNMLINVVSRRVKQLRRGNRP